MGVSVEDISGFSRSPEADAVRNADILLVEDDEINQAVVREILRARPQVKLHMAQSGEEALHLALERRFDLLIIDRKIPGISGERLIRHLRASNNPNTGSKIVLFSATPVSELAASPVAALADHLLSKPVRAADFLAVVDNLLSDGTQRR